MARPRGGYIGFNRQVTSTAASGVWTLSELTQFQKSGEWPYPAVEVLCLVVAGGGGGGAYRGGGGGAGGVLYGLYFVPLYGFNVHVGGGGFGGNETNPSGTNGQNSFIALTAELLGGPPSESARITAFGGGRGAVGLAGLLDLGVVDGGFGGSGGGGSGYPTAGVGGWGVTGQGNPGGGGDGVDEPYGGGGGGGAGGNGQNAYDVATFDGAAGGAGLDTYSDMLDLFSVGEEIDSVRWIAGGGGGGVYQAGIGAGGAGGGGDGGGTDENGDSGLANTGGGGGGGGNAAFGGDGGSGVVIIRLPTTNEAAGAWGDVFTATSGGHRFYCFKGHGGLYIG